MADHPASHFTSRRAFLRAVLTLPAGAMLAGCIAPAATPAALEPTPALDPDDASTAIHTSEPSAVSEVTPDLASVLEPTLACGDDDDEPTLAQTEGPYYTPNTPERSSLLEPGITGTNLLLSGFVLRTDCTSVARALVDFWHCDDAGVYDNVGYRLRGHQFTDEQGRYQLTTIVPGLYTGRTRHIHVKVQAPNQPVLTTQLYFPDEPANERDGIFHPSLVVAVGNAASDADQGMNALFDFVLA
jgi:protocatechuate 3,4-dioxygenase beta subunit